ncbi:MAG: YraN family protein, partial [Pseudomonadota bacterium]
MSDTREYAASVATETSRRRRRERAGRTAEHVAAVVLILKGYRILARRLQTHAGEIDIVAVRGRRLAFVEVKQRSDLGSARFAVTPRQQQRLQRAADAFVQRYSKYRSHDRGFDRFEV